MRHELLLYAQDDTLVDVVAPFLEDGLAAGDAVVTVLDTRKLDLLRAALGAQAKGVAWIDVASHYTRPEAAVADYDARLRALVGDGVPHVRLFGELPPLRSEAQCDAWIAYDAILNQAFDHHPVSVLCGYDRRAVPERVLGAARKSHPVVHGHGLNDAFADPAAIVRAHTPEPEPVPGLRTIPAGDGARALRRALVAAMTAAGLGPRAIGGMVLAANEVVANAYRYAGGPPEVRAGSADGRFVCEITDSGTGFDDPLAGHLPPRARGDRGAGLWIARQSTSRLEMVRSEGGQTVRLWA